MRHTVPQKLLFAHTPKTAGVHLSEYIVSRLSYRLIRSEKRSADGIWTDFTLDELQKYIPHQGSLIDTHTLSFGWSQLAYNIPKAQKDQIVAMIQKFRENGWFSFTFIRHPGDLLCSFYHYVFDYYTKRDPKTADAFCPVVDRSIDEFVKEHCDRELLPSYMDECDFVAEANDANFKRFFLCYFDHEFQCGKAPSHASSNKGYAFYCKNVTISKETQAKVSRSINMKIYNEVIRNRNLASEVSS